MDNKLVYFVSVLSIVVIVVVVVVAMVLPFLLLITNVAAVVNRTRGTSEKDDYASTPIHGNGIVVSVASFRDHGSLSRAIRLSKTRKHLLVS